MCGIVRDVEQEIKKQGSTDGSRSCWLEINKYSLPEKDNLLQSRNQSNQIYKLPVKFKDILTGSKLRTSTKRPQEIMRGPGNVNYAKAHTLVYLRNTPKYSFGKIDTHSFPSHFPQLPSLEKKKKKEEEKPAIGRIHNETLRMPQKQKLLTPKEIDPRKH